MEQKATLTETGLAKYLLLSLTLNQFCYRWTDTNQGKRSMLCKDTTALLALADQVGVKDNKLLNLCIRVLNEQTVMSGTGPDATRRFSQKVDGLNGYILQTFFDEDSTCNQKNHKDYYGYVWNLMEAINQLAHVVVSWRFRNNLVSDSAMHTPHV